MRLGRFSIGWARNSYWGYEKVSCECHILEMGRVYFMWNGKNCKCVACNGYTCVCEPDCPLCGKDVSKCDCEKFE
jgi:hypothetical protein